jgi:predicted dehydrogenase
MPLSFGIIGSGWRREFFLRIARDLPEQFPLAGVVARNPDKRAELARRWSAPTFSTLDELLAEKRPDFVVTSVSASANLEWMEFLSERGVPILSETPIGRDLKELHRVVDLERVGARIQVAEQYIFQPLHAARGAYREWSVGNHTRGGRLDCSRLPRR